MLVVSPAQMASWKWATVQRVREEDVTVRKEPTPPGEVGEVDYGRMAVVDVLGRRRVLQGFLMTLPFSRHLFVDIVDHCDQASWVRSHVAAFTFFGGAPRVLRLDNLKTGVLRPDIYDPRLNRAYAELAEHYGELLDPCRAGKPKDKAHVERAVPYAGDSLVRGREHLGQRRHSSLGMLTPVEFEARHQPTTAA